MTNSTTRTIKARQKPRKRAKTTNKQHQTQKHKANITGKPIKEIEWVGSGDTRIAGGNWRYPARPRSTPVGSEMVGGADRVFVWRANVPRSVVVMHIL